MTTNSNLPPELQARLAQIQQQAAAGAPAPVPVQKPPSLMDHLIALRQEVAAMRQEMAQLGAVVQANSNVVEGVGGAVGHIYQMFQQTSDPSPTYSQGFQQAQPGVEDADY